MISLTKLRELAKAATPGPWKHEQGNGSWWRLLYYGPASYGKRWESEDGEDWALLGQHDRANGVDQYSSNNAAYIASANPAVMLEMIERMEKLEAVAAHVRDEACCATCEAAAALDKVRK